MTLATHLSHLEVDNSSIEVDDLLLLWNELSLLCSSEGMVKTLLNIEQLVFLGESHDVVRSHSHNTGI